MSAGPQKEEGEEEEKEEEEETNKLLTPVRPRQVRESSESPVTAPGTPLTAVHTRCCAQRASACDGELPMTF